MAKRGRPSKFGTVDLDQVQKLAAKGWTDEEMAKFFNVAISTWDGWKTANQDFMGALKDWKAEADARVERSLYERAMGYSHMDTKFATHEGKITDQREYVRHYPPDTTACIFWLKNRDKENWRDVRHNENTGKDGGPMQVSGVMVAPAEVEAGDWEKQAQKQQRQ